MYLPNPQALAAGTGTAGATVTAGRGLLASAVIGFAVVAGTTIFGVLRHRRNQAAETEPAST